MATFNATFSESRQFTASFLDSENLNAEFGNIQYIVVGDYYEGDYEVTPRLSQQVLETEDKLMLDDVTVHPIPVVSTSNPYGGQTVVIG